MTAIEGTVAVALVVGFGAFLFTRWKKAQKQHDENAKNPGSGGGRPNPNEKEK